MNNHHRVQMHFEFINPQKLNNPVQNQPKPVQTKPKLVQTKPKPVQTKPKLVQIKPKPVQPQPRPVQLQPRPVQPQPRPVQPQPKPVELQPKPVELQPKPLVTPTTSRYICNCVKDPSKIEINDHLVWQIEQQVKQQQQIVDEWDKEFERMRVRELEILRTDVIRELDTLIAISNYMLTS